VFAAGALVALGRDEDGLLEGEVEGLEWTQGRSVTSTSSPHLITTLDVAFD
jgi:hypothetical protein